MDRLKIKNLILWLGKRGLRPKASSSSWIYKATGKPRDSPLYIHPNGSRLVNLVKMSAVQGYGFTDLYNNPVHSS